GWLLLIPIVPTSHGSTIWLPRRQELSGGVLYIGQGRTFIQYRDGNAPRGYDAAQVQPSTNNECYLVDREGTHPISLQVLTGEPLNDLLLHIPLLPASGTGLPKVVFALVAPPLYRVLARYFRDHHLPYRLARFQAATG